MRLKVFLPLRAPGLRQPPKPVQFIVGEASESRVVSRQDHLHHHCRQGASFLIRYSVHDCDPIVLSSRRQQRGDEIGMPPPRSGKTTSTEDQPRRRSQSMLSCHIKQGNNGTKHDTHSSSYSVAKKKPRQSGSISANPVRPGQ